MIGPAPADTLPALYEALAKAAANFLPIAKNRTVKIATRAGGSYLFRYADLDAIIAATRPSLAACGLSVVQPILTTEGGTVLATTLLHSGGGYLTSSVPLPGMTGDPKEYGALITYLRRYAYTALLCVASDDDLDQDGGGSVRALAPDRLAAHLQAIADAPTYGVLKTAYAAALAEAEQVGDADAIKRFAKARDAKMAAASGASTKGAGNADG